jgi:hypothetical protein
MNPSFQNEGTFIPDALFAGDFERVTDSITLIDGQNLSRGAVLGKITASGKYTLSLAAAEDGSEVPCAILAADTDASEGDVTTAIYHTGVFNQDALTFGTGHSKTTAATRDALRERSIFLKPIVSF